MKKSFVFDLDGTLIDTGIDLANAMNYALERLTFPTKHVSTLISYIGDGLDTYVMRAFETDNQNIIEKAKKIFEDFYRQHSHDSTALYNDVKETLEVLQKNHIPMFVLSNKPIEFIPTLLQKMSIAHYFSDIVGQYSLPKIKPEPDGLFYLMNKFHLSSESMFMIGDNYTDIEAGKSAGIQTIFCQFGLGKISDIQPDFEIKQFRELLKFI